MIQFAPILSMRCSECCTDINEAVACCNAVRCIGCNYIHRQPTEEQRAAATDFCISMHFACAADGLGRCPVCGVHISMEAQPPKA